MLQNCCVGPSDTRVALEHTPQCKCDCKTCNMTSDPSCIFCDIVRGTAPAQIVCEDARSIAFLDIAPAAEGHTLVIPRTHFRTLLDVDETSAGALMSFATRGASVIVRPFHPEGI